MTAHVARFPRMVSGPKKFFDHLDLILHRLIIHLQNYMLDDRWSDAFVGQGKLNGPIAAIELEDRPDRTADLLALHVSRVTGNAQRTDSYKSRDDCVVSTGPPLRLFLWHGTDPIAGKMSVNQSSRINF